MISKSELIRQHIVSALRGGRWQPGEQLPALAQLAQEMGVSRWPVEHALQKLIHEGILERRPKHGTFVRHSSTPALYDNASIAIVGSGPVWCGSYLNVIMGAFVDELGDRDWVFLRYQSVEETAHRLRLLGIPFLVAPVPTQDKLPILEQLSASGIKVLCLGGRLQSNLLHSISVDNAHGMMSAVNHLVQLGHRRIATIHWPLNQTDLTERLQAFRLCAKQYDLEDSEALLACHEKPYSHEDFTEYTIDRWFSQPTPPTAILTTSGDFTPYLLKGLARRGIAVPEDVSVLTFDDHVNSELMPTPLCSVRQPLEMMGRRAAQLLALLPEHIGAPFNIVLPLELVIRESCAAPKYVLLR